MFQSPRVGASSSPSDWLALSWGPSLFQSPRVGASSSPATPVAATYRHEVFQSPRVGASSSPFALRRPALAVLYVSIPSCRGKFFTRACSSRTTTGSRVSIPSCRGKFFTPRRPVSSNPTSPCFNPLVSGQVLHRRKSGETTQATC